MSFILPEPAHCSAAGVWHSQQACCMFAPVGCSLCWSVAKLSFLIYDQTHTRHPCRKASCTRGGSEVNWSTPSLLAQDGMARAGKPGSADHSLQVFSRPGFSLSLTQGPFWPTALHQPACMALTEDRLNSTTASIRCLRVSRLRWKPFTFNPTFSNKRSAQAKTLPRDLAQQMGD